MEDLKTMFATFLVGAVLKTVGSTFSSVTGALVDRKELKKIQKRKGMKKMHVLKTTLVVNQKELESLAKTTAWQKGRDRGDTLKRNGGLEKK